MLLTVSGSTCFGQSWEDEPDAIAFDTYSPSVAQRQSVNSLSSADISKITQPVKLPDGRWTTRNVGFGRQTAVSRGSRPSSSRKAYRGTGTHTSGPSRSVIARRRAQREEQIREYKRQQALKRERIRRENAEDFQRGFTLHKAATSGFYSREAQRDYYMATEGAARLDASFTATDYARIPNKTASVQLNTATKDDLLNLLSGSGGLAMADESASRVDNFKVGDTFDANTTDRLDESEFDKWNEAFNSKPYVGDCSGDSMKLKTELILSADCLDIDTLPRFTIPYVGFAFSHIDTVFTVYPDTIKASRWNNLRVEYAIGCGNRLIIKDHNSLWKLDKARFSKLFSFETENFSIFPKDDNAFYVLLWLHDLSIAYEVNLVENTKTEIARLPELIWKIEAGNNAVYFAINNDIFLLTPDNIPILFYRDEKRINDFILTAGGMLIAYDDGVELVDDGFTRHFNTTEEVKELYNDGRRIYAVSNDNNIYNLSFQ